jgi:hypothetical protein
VWNGFANNVFEGAVTLIEVKAVGFIEIVPDIEIHETIVVGIPPRRGKTVPSCHDSRFLGDVGE